MLNTELINALLKIQEVLHEDESIAEENLDYYDTVITEIVYKLSGGNAMQHQRIRQLTVEEILQQVKGGG
tara:strand:+ start:881 stop:1090 length:210 start_codon:yes stop_codon:yes gene_type:complete